jgi:hypothetical protein
MPTLISGLQNLLSTASGWLLGIIPVGGGLMAGYHWFMSGAGAGGDEMVAAQHKRATRNVLFGTILAMSAMGLVRVLASFF